MAIDPAVLAKQRIGPAARHEVQCIRCGKRTTDKKGVCIACRRGHIPDLTKMKPEQIASLIEACRSELQRRRDELNAVLGAP